MKNRLFLTVISIAAVVVFSCSCAGGQQGISGNAPDFKLNKLDGGVFKLSEELKSKNVVLVFWASWCPYCVNEIPDVKAFASKNADTYSVLGVNFREKQALVSKFVKRLGINYPVGLDSDGAVADMYGVRGLPTVVAVSKSGEVTYMGHDIREIK